MKMLPLGIFIFTFIFSQQAWNENSPYNIYFILYVCYWSYGGWFIHACFFFTLSKIFKCPYLIFMWN